MNEKFLINNYGKIILLKNNNFFYSPSDKKDGVFLGLNNFKELFLPLCIFENPNKFISKINDDNKDVLIDYFIKHISINKISKDKLKKYSILYKLINKYKHSLLFYKDMKTFNENIMLDNGYFWCFYKNITTIIYVEDKIIYDFYNNKFRPSEFKGIILGKI